MKIYRVLLSMPVIKGLGQKFERGGAHRPAFCIKKTTGNAGGSKKL